MWQSRSKGICLSSKNDPWAQHSTQLCNICHLYIPWYIPHPELQSVPAPYQHQHKERVGMNTAGVLGSALKSCSVKGKTTPRGREQQQTWPQHVAVPTNFLWVESLNFLSKFVQSSLIWTMANGLSLILLLQWSRTLCMVFVHKKVSNKSVQ